MRLLPIVYDYASGLINEEEQSVIEVTQDFIDLIESGKSVMVRKLGDKIVVMTDDARWNFKSR